MGSPVGWLPLLAIVGMAAVTLATRWVGLWFLDRFPLPPRAAAALEAVPGAVIIGLVVPELAGGGPPEWGAAVLVLLVAVRTGSLVLSMPVGMAAVVVLRALL